MLFAAGGDIIGRILSVVQNIATSPIINVIAIVMKVNLSGKNSQNREEKSQQIISIIS